MIDRSYRNLKAALNNLLKTQDPTLNYLDSIEYPLLIMETSVDSVGFAVANGTPQAAYNSAYRTFKNLYQENISSWKNRNISFVICRSDPKPSDDAFFGSIEADIYFCRKYVIFLSSERDALERELLRLPFTPLPEAFERVIEIPPSAHTLLQSIGVPALLANKIINPGLCSAERLTDELLTEVGHLPDLEMEILPGYYEQAESKNITRIKDISIEAFRGYRKRQEFDLDADVIVLYGPNGLGKTSFFDAIDYACTGRIGRFCQGRIEHNEFIEIARNLDASVDKGLVSMQVIKNGTDFVINRKVADWTYAQIDNKRVDRASLIQFLTSAEWSSKKPRVNKLESIFRATHLFSQTDPELLSSFDKHSTLSNEIVSRMLALDDYSTALKKLSEADIELEKRRKQNQNELMSLNTEEYEVSRRIKSLPDPSNLVKAGNQLKRMASEVAELIRSEINVTIDTADLNPILAREWRALVEAELENADESLQILQGIEHDFISFSRNCIELDHISDELGKIEEKHKKRTIVLKEKKQAIKKLESALKRNQTIYKKANLKLIALSELVDHQKVSQISESSIQKLRKELVHLEEECNATNLDLQKHIYSLESLETQVADIIDEYQVILEHVKKISQIQEEIPIWNKEQKTITKLDNSKKEIKLELETAGTKIREIKSAINISKKELIKCIKDLDDWSENELALTRLLDEIETHIHNSICPVCGTKHVSKNALVKKINLQKQTRPPHIEALSKRRIELQYELTNEQESLDAQETRFNEKKQELEEIEKLLQEAQESVDIFETSVRSVGLVANQQLATKVTQKLNDEMASQLRLEKDLTNFKAKTAATRKQISSLERKQSQLEKTRKRLKYEIKVHREQVSTIQNMLEEQDLTLEMSPDEIAELMVKDKMRKERASERIDDLATQVERNNQLIETLEIENSDLMQKIEDLRQNVTRLNDEIGSYQKRATGEIGSEAITLDAIQKKNINTVKRVDRLDDLRTRTLTLERSLDSSQRSALLAELKAKSLSIEREKRKLSESNDRIEAVEKWFSIVERSLFQENSNAVTNYVEAFGPLTSLIQKRLRAVYGFGDIILKARGDEIQIMVRRKEERYKPNIYFSDSQKQILTLSIFLAGRITQTWSGFAPILMDDPVTHFDDLNAFGFVEFMRGVINTSLGNRQFIISTCEERLFDLMLRKFKGATGGAIFYKFTNIGPDGPTIKQIIN
jgi:exonuclease SbcC